MRRCLAACGEMGVKWDERADPPVAHPTSAPPFSMSSSRAPVAHAADALPASSLLHPRDRLEMSSQTPWFKGGRRGGASRKAALRAGTAEVGAPPTGPLSLSAATPTHSHSSFSRRAAHPTTPPRRTRSRFTPTMASAAATSARQDAKHERALKALLKLPDNRRCAVCDTLVRNRGRERGWGALAPLARAKWRAGNGATGTGRRWALLCLVAACARVRERESRAGATPVPLRPVHPLTPRPRPHTHYHPHPLTGPPVRGHRLQHLCLRSLQRRPVRFENARRRFFLPSPAGPHALARAEGGKAFASAPLSPLPALSPPPSPSLNPAASSTTGARA